MPETEPVVLEDGGEPGVGGGIEIHTGIAGESATGEGYWLMEEDGGAVGAGHNSAVFVVDGQYQVDDVNDVAVAEGHALVGWFEADCAGLQVLR